MVFPGCPFVLQVAIVSCVLTRSACRTITLRLLFLCKDVSGLRIIFKASIYLHDIVAVRPGVRTLASTCNILCICTERSEFFPEAFWLDLAATRIFLVYVTHWKHLESRKENKNVENPGPYSKIQGSGRLCLQNLTVLTWEHTACPAENVQERHLRTWKKH